MEPFQGSYIPTLCKVGYSEKDYLKKFTHAIKNQLELENNNYQQNDLFSDFFQPRSFSDRCKKLFEIADHPGQSHPIALFTQEKEFKVFIEYAAYIDLLAHKSHPQHPIDQVWHILQKCFYKKFNKAMRNLAFQEAVIQKIVNCRNNVAQNKSEKFMDEKFQELKDLFYWNGFLYPLNDYKHEPLLKLWALFGYIENYTKNEKIDIELPEIYRKAYDFIRYETYDYIPYPDHEREKKEYRYYSDASGTWIALNEEQYRSLSDKSNYREYRTLDYIISSPLITEIDKYISSHYDKIIEDLSSYNPKLKSILSNSSTLLLKLPPPALYNNNSSELAKNLEP